MTEATKISILESMMDGSEQRSDILAAYLKLAERKILNRMYPYKENYDDVEMPDKYANIQLNIACYMLNKRGAEGQIQHIENGVHRNYGDADIPDSMLRDVMPFAQAIR